MKRPNLQFGHHRFLQYIPYCKLIALGDIDRWMKANEMYLDYISTENGITEKSMVKNGSDEIWAMEMRYGVIESTSDTCLGAEK